MYNLPSSYTSGLKQSNVEGTKEVLVLASTGRPKFLHYVSTVGVFAPRSSAEVITEETATDCNRYDRVCNTLLV